MSSSSPLSCYSPAGLFLKIFFFINLKKKILYKLFSFLKDINNDDDQNFIHQLHQHQQRHIIQPTNHHAYEQNQSVSSSSANSSALNLVHQQQQQQKNNINLNSSIVSKTSDRNVHCVKEKIRR
jgi:hypothetical protein